jgi:hypothetical protein
VTLQATRPLLCKLWLVSLWLGFTGGNSDAGDLARPSFKTGDMVRFNSVDKDGVPGMVPVSTSLADLRTFLRTRHGAEARAGGFPSVEGMMFAGHNTLATVVELEALPEPEGRTVEFVQVTLGAGGFKGQNVWAALSGFRGSNEPDPAPVLWFRSYGNGNGVAKRTEERKADQVKASHGNGVAKRTEERKADQVKTSSVLSALLSSAEKRRDKLVLTDLVSNPSPTGKNLKIVGRFRNVSGEDLKTVRVTISFRDRAGKLVGSERSLCVPRVSAPSR